MVQAKQAGVSKLHLLADLASSFNKLVILGTLVLEWGILLHLGLRRLPFPWRLHGAGSLRQTTLPLPGLWPYPQPAAMCLQ